MAPSDGENGRAMEWNSKPSSEDPQAITRALPHEGDLRVGRLAVANGFLTSEQFQSAAEEFQELAKAGERPRFEQILLQHRYLTAEQLATLVGEADSGTHRRSVGRYQIRRLIGRGGMGAVYEAIDPELRRSVALKVIREGEAQPETIARLHREAAILAQLRHPNIVGIHEAGSVQDESGETVHFISMDYIAGHTLDGVLRDRQMAASEKVRMLDDVARAVAHAHTAGILHRDLKPGNVLVDPQGVVYLTDFGLACAQQFQTVLTRSREVIGTPQYMAPEQVEGRTREIDERTDIYALGVIFYQILTGQLPYPGKTFERVYHEILHFDPVWPSRVRREVSRDAEVICMKALEKERRRRYATALEFAEDLGRYRRGEPILARPVSTAYRVRKWIRRRGIFVAAVAAVLLAIAGTTVFLQGQRSKEKVRDGLRIARDFEDRSLWAEAVREYDRVLQFSAEEPAAVAGRGRAQGHIDRKRTVFQVVQGIRADLDRVNELLYSPDVTAEGIESALQPAREKCREALEMRPEMAELYELEGRMWEWMGENERAEQSYRKAMELDPGNGWVHFRLGRLQYIQANLFLCGDKWRAEAQVRTTQEGVKNLSLALTDPRIRADAVQKRLATCWLALVREEWDKLAEEAIREDGNRPGEEEFHFLAGHLGSSYQEKVARLDRALHIRPRYGIALFQRGFMRQEEGRLRDAISDYTEALRIHPRMGLAYYNRGIAYRELGEGEAALSDFRRLLEWEPGDLTVRYNLSIALKQSGQVDAALDEIERMIAAKVPFSGPYYDRGCIYQIRGEWEAAMASYAQALKVNSNDGPSYVHRAILHRLQGREAEAQRELEQAKAVQTDWATRFGCQAELLELEGERRGAVEEARKTLAVQRDPVYRRLMEDLLRRMGEEP